MTFITFEEFYEPEPRLTREEADRRMKEVERSFELRKQGNAREYARQKVRERYERRKIQFSRLNPNYTR